MSKYKVGDEILIKAKITDVEPQDHYPYVVMTPTGQKPWLKEDDITGLAEDEYNRGLQDAWELARKIVLDESKGGIPDRDMRSMFGEKWRVSDILKDFTPQEALAKIEAYEKEQEQIKVGDVVECMDVKAVVVGVRKTEICVICSDGSAGYWAKEDATKTGKHLDIASILAEIGKE